MPSNRTINRSNQGALLIDSSRLPLMPVPFPTVAQQSTKPSRQSPRCPLPPPINSSPPPFQTLKHVSRGMRAAAPARLRCVSRATMMTRLGGKQGTMTASWMCVRVTSGPSPLRVRAMMDEEWRRRLMKPKPKPKSSISLFLPNQSVASFSKTEVFLNRRTELN